MTMDFSPPSLPELAPTDWSQLAVSHTGQYNPPAEQAYGLYVVDTAFAFAPQAQIPGGHFATTQNHAPPPSSLATVLPSHVQYDAAFIGNSQSGSAAPVGPASPMGPPARPRKLRKPKAPTLRAQDWEPYKERILKLHIEDNLPLQKVMQTMENEYGFKAEYVPPTDRRQRQSQDVTDTDTALGCDSTDCA